jgi:hypothetical protein
LNPLIERACYFSFYLWFLQILPPSSHIARGRKAWTAIYSVARRDATHYPPQPRHSGDDFREVTDGVNGEFCAIWQSRLRQGG